MSLTWLVIRGSGLVAYALLAASTIWGLVLSTKVLGRSKSVKDLTYAHEALAVGGAVATVVHMVFIVMDTFVEFTVWDVLVPGLSAWEPLAVAWGVVAFYGILVTGGTFYFRKRIGQSVWRAVHYGTFGVFAAAAIHGVTAGTDTGNVAVMGMYVSTSTVVVALIALRALLAGSERERHTKDGAGVLRRAGADRPHARAGGDV